MSRLELHWHDYRYFPYERRLAVREAETLLDATVVDQSDRSLIVQAKNARPDRLARLTYFSEVILPSCDSIVPTQAKLEHSGGNGRHLPQIYGRLPRQSTRYSAHGVHEYRGKFNPQVVRAIGNIVGLEPEAWVLDPYCGSGTTLLESLYCGWNAVGLDINPLAVEIANAKLVAAGSKPRLIGEAADELLERLRKLFEDVNFEVEWSDAAANEIAGGGWRGGIPEYEYLSSWFPRSVLVQLSVILSAIEDYVPEPLHGLFRVLLSDVVRDSSLQDPADLRVRRRKDPAPNYAAYPRFATKVVALVDQVGRAERVVGLRNVRQSARLADGRYDLTAHVGDQQFDAVITSPPYVTALPYIDTQRLSLCLLGLETARGIRALERQLIGSRELRLREQKALADCINQPSHSLPKSVIDLCRAMEQAASLPGNGFRRRAMPSLAYRYFTDSHKVLSNVARVLRTGGTFALVVGVNQTTLGGQTFTIDTPTLIADVAESVGWSKVGDEEFDTYQRYDIHQANSIRSERLITLARD